jgi:hypothetical protein
MNPFIAIFRILLAALGGSLLGEWKIAAAIGAVVVINSLLLIWVVRRRRKHPSCCR